MLKLDVCYEEASYISAMKPEGYVYFLFIGNNNLHYNGSKIYLFKSKEAAEEIAREELEERKRKYKIGKTFFVKETSIYLEEIHEIKLNTPSIDQFLWRQPDDQMWGLVQSDGSIKVNNDGLPLLVTLKEAQQTSVPLIVKLAHYTADGSPIVVEQKLQAE